MRIIRLRELYYACSTIFFREVRCKTGWVVREADPYGGIQGVWCVVGGRTEASAPTEGLGVREAGDREGRPYGDYLKFLDGRCGCCDFL